MCTCVSGWTGRDCNTNIDNCNPNVCHHRATCVDEVANFRCECPEGKAGMRHLSA